MESLTETYRREQYFKRIDELTHALFGDAVITIPIPEPSAPRADAIDTDKQA